MKRCFIFQLALFLCYLSPVFSITNQDLEKIGEKIWDNECKKSLNGLTSWNDREDFASIGIGHFIWYPDHKERKFEESFPQFIGFIKQKKPQGLPQFLLDHQSCPWNSKEAFYENFYSSDMQELREFLIANKHLQIGFMFHRLKLSLPKMIKACSKKEKRKVTMLFKNLSKSIKGLYVLIDYLNFKGSGINPEENYEGYRWGLLQVLLLIPDHSSEPIGDFVKTAKTLLLRRVSHAPVERQEEKWVKGWMNRLNTYLEDI
ncbi:MAG: hypothetical protein R3E91_06090 [Chlamydiales bacterium]